MSPIKTLAVVVPIYGHHGYIRECLNSLTSQWTSLNQIILVVDGDEKALKIAMECFYDSKCRGLFTVAMLNENCGTYHARNVGLSILDSDAVSFCDADDLWIPSRSRDILRSFHSNNSIVNTYSCQIDASGSRLKRSIHPLGGAYCYSMDMIERLGMFRQWACSADSDMFYRAQKLGGHLSMYRAYSYLYRQHGDQLTHNKETGFGSEVRGRYESMWHDETIHHQDDLSPHRIIVLNGRKIDE